MLNDLAVRYCVRQELVAGWVSRVALWMWVVSVGVGSSEANKASRAGGRAG